MYQLDVAKYPNAEPLIKDDPRNSVPWDRMLLRPKTMDSFFAAMFYVDSRTERGFSTPHLIFPFALGARQDRLNPSGDFLFTAKSIAKEINMRNFPSVTVVDCHSEVMPALIDRCRNVPLASIIVPTSIFNTLNENVQYRRKYDGVISPDAGAEKRASAVAKKLGVPLFHGWKKRNVTTGALDGFGVEELPSNTRYGPRFLIVDDICDGGGTFLGLAKYIKEYCLTCRLDLLVTHGIFSQGTSKLKEYFGVIYTTDSIIPGINDINQISICESLLGGNL